MMLPRWIPFLIAAWVIAFGILRLRIASRKDEDEGDKPNYRKGGYYAKSKRSHRRFGIAYLILGAYCIAMGFGYQIDFVSTCQGSQSTSETAPSQDEAVPVGVAK